MKEIMKALIWTAAPHQHHIKVASGFLCLLTLLTGCGKSTELAESQKNQTRSDSGLFSVSPDQLQHLRS